MAIDLKAEISGRITRQMEKRGFDINLSSGTLNPINNKSVLITEKTETIAADSKMSEELGTSIKVRNAFDRQKASIESVYGYIKLYDKKTERIIDFLDIKYDLFTQTLPQRNDILKELRANLNSRRILQKLETGKNRQLQTTTQTKI